MDSTEIHNVLTAKAKLDAEIRRLTDAFDDEHAGKLVRIIELFEQQTNEKFHVRGVHHEMTVYETELKGRFGVWISNGGEFGDDDCQFSFVVEQGRLVSAYNDFRDRPLQIKETGNV